MKRFIPILFLLLLLSAFKPNEQEILKTQLIITVLDDLGTIQEGATVKLFKTVEDYNNSTNQVLETMTTNAKGKVRFIGLEPIAYYVEVKNGSKDNSLAAEQTSVLKEGKINKANIVISD